MPGAGPSSADGDVAEAEAVVGEAVVVETAGGEALPEEVTLAEAAAVAVAPGEAPGGGVVCVVRGDGVVAASDGATANSPVTRAALAIVTLTRVATAGATAVSSAPRALVTGRTRPLMRCLSAG